MGVLSGLVNSPKFEMAKQHRLENPVTADEKLAYVSRKEFEEFEGKYTPRGADLEATLGRNDLVEGARESATTQGALAQASDARQLGRYSANLTPMQRKVVERRQSLGTATTTSNAVNNATIDQRERDFGVGTELVNQSRGQTSLGVSALSSAAQNEAQRNAANDVNKAQAKAGKMGAAASGAATGAMIGSVVPGVGTVVGGVVGGVAGYVLG